MRSRAELAQQGLAEISLLFAADLGLIPPMPPSYENRGLLVKRRVEIPGWRARRDEWYGHGDENHVLVVRVDVIKEALAKRGGGE